MESWVIFAGIYIIALLILASIFDIDVDDDDDNL